MRTKALVLVTLVTLVGANAQPVTEIYHVVFLKRDPARKPISKEEGERIQSAHMANIHSMADRGLLVAAGPFEDEPPVISGIFVFRTSSLEEAKRVAAEDPTVVEHRNTVEIVEWRGPKGIGEEYARLHKQDPKTPEGMGVHPFYLLLRSNTWDEYNMILKQHQAYVADLLHTGKLAAAGPVSNSDTIAEILIFERIPDGEAAALAASDPGIKKQLFHTEAHHWWSSAHVLPHH